ncbi:hypothetical protein IAG41_17020 [Sphingomonas sp. JC676]|uniref:hypothetical protein n=1 Tax=Sphingomonas sp. JC676 TaxID=2768065 RepID=UPI001657D31C|nr:hypothetical protein [Sphingomonas sp. JC676]MBC9034092.1 hypothetical protein [Sphingomonas sp. JC676]
MSEPRAGSSTRQLLLVLFALFALSNVLVPVFLGKAGPAAVSAIVACGFLVLLWLGEGRIAQRDPVRWRTIGICLAIACALLLLGGEGRLFYANEDWQIRDAVLADMAGHPWPFAYLTGGGEQVLRAPLGMYLLPAIIGRGSRTATDLALLACNTLMLGLLLALASTLFETARARFMAVIVFIAFSGLDIVGTVIANSAGVASYDHLERWSPPLQYSSVITLIFWVPQHAIAGWFCALLYLLYRRGSMTLGSVAASVPLAAIWSPLAVIGAVPLVAWAGLRAIHGRTLRWTDVATGVAALAVAVPALAYLAADAQQLPSGLRGVRPLTFATFLLLELFPSLWILYRLRAPHRLGFDTLVLVTAMLVLIPLFHIGAGDDFAMRVSIVPLAVLVALLASSLTEADAQIPRPTGIAIAILLSLGAITGTAEVWRALRLAAAPPPLCSLPSAWVRQSGRIGDISTYLARTSAMPGWLHQDMPTLIDPGADPRDCWSRPWKATRYG